VRNELLGYLSIPVIVAGGMSVWKGLNPDQGLLEGLKWSEARPDTSKDEMAAYDAEEAAEMEEAEEEGDSSYADQGSYADH
jgi:hypothetical protein